MISKSKALLVLFTVCFAGCGIRFELPNVTPHSDKPDPPDCNGNACSFVSIASTVADGYTVKNIGTKKARVTIEFGAPFSQFFHTEVIVLASGKESGPYAYAGMKLPYTAEEVASTTPVTPPTNAIIKDFTIDHADITAGQTFNLTLVLNKPAPADGLEVSFLAGSHDGSLNVFVDYPYGIWTLKIPAGKTSVPIPIKTHRVQGAPMKVFITATHSEFSYNQKSITCVIR